MYVPITLTQDVVSDFFIRKDCSVHFFIRKVVVYCLAVFKIHAIAKLSSKPMLLHPSNPCRFLLP
jgi:hypothetical protein